MELNNIKTKDISWGEAASALNENFGKIGTDVEKIKNATIKNKGYYASVADLTSAFPSAQIGDYAYVGSQAPYQTWHWTIEGWEKLNDDGGNINVELDNYYPKSDIDGKLSYLASNQGLFLNNNGRSKDLTKIGYYDAIVDVNIELKTSADRYYYYLISYISKDQNSAGIYRYDRELNIKEHYMTLSKVEYVGNLVKLYSGANPLSYIVVDYEKLTANPSGITKDDGVFLNPTVCHYANNYSYTDRLTFVDTPARDGNTESSSGYYRGYTIPLRDLYNKGIRGLLFRGSNHIATSNILSGLVVDKDGNVSSIVKNPNESKNNGWYTVEIKENDDYFKGTYTTSEEGGEVYTPEVVYLLNEYDFIANNVKKLVFCEKDISAFVVRANGRINYTTGEKISSQGYHYSVDIPKGQYDKLYAYFSNNNTGGEANTGYAFYDSEGAYISGGTFTKRAYNTIDVPSNAVLFKNTALTDPNNTCILKTSSSISYRVEYLNQEVGKMKDSALNISDAVVSSVGKDGMRMFVESLLDGEELSAEEFPYCNKLGNQYSVSCKIGTFDKVVFAQGYNNYRGFHIEFSKYDVKVYFDSSLKETQTHGLDIKDFLKFNIQHKDSGRFRISLMTNGGNYSFESSFNTYDMNGLLKLISIGSKLSQVKLSATNDRFRCPIWIFGASYEGVSSSRWVGQCKKMGYFNYLLNGLAGRDSSTTAADLNRAMKFGCPKYLYLTIWGNGSVDSLDTTIESVRSTCEENGITLILTNRPNSLAEDVQNTYVNRKSVIDKYIAMGIRYVDLAEAVSMNESEADGWYDGFLSSDLKHPTELGAQAMAYQVLSDFPEIMQYGLYKDDIMLEDTGTDK